MGLIGETLLSKKCNLIDEKIHIFESDVYKCTIKQSNIARYKSGTLSVNFIFDIDGNQYKEKFITNQKTEKGGNSYYTNSNGKSVALNGYTICSDIFYLLEGVELGNVSKSEEMLANLKNKQLLIGLIKKKEAELSNFIDKVFNLQGLTASELKASRDLGYVKSWLDTNKGRVVNVQRD